MQLIAAPLRVLIESCYRLSGGYLPAIILFTLLTKVILFPVALWTHQNGLKMVALTPALNRLKVQFFGDKDAIAEETDKLYRQEHYHPLVSTLPMFVQLALLIGVIGAVRDLLGTSGSALLLIPASVGGTALAMPAAAGCSALLLGLSQNRFNPLQREQSNAEQWMSNGLSIGISLVLGAFVPLGVGAYWICSNLFTIAQQLVLNRVMPPEKYVDYAALAESKKELGSLNSLGGQASPEDRRREKADYKRFFSIANKHLVFYSEKSGFYKYFQTVIEYLLEHSNIIIHYVTSDPQDQVFELTKTQPRIRPYYIGEKKLITLMMKMDADIVVMTMPDLENFHIKRSYVRKDIEYIYMFHYPLSTHMVLRTGALDHYDTIFCVGDFQHEEIRQSEALYHTPEKKLITCGYGQLEALYASYKAMPEPRREVPKVLIAPSWQPGNILDSCLDPLLSELMQGDFQIVVRPHPEYMKRYAPKMKAIVDRWQGRLPNDRLCFELNFTSNTSIFDSDILISDWSGTAYEFSFVTLKPAVFIDTPQKVNNPDYVKLNIPPLELTLRNQVGIRVSPDALDGLNGRLQQLIDQKNDYAGQIRTLRDQYIAHFGSSGQIGGRYILEQLKDRSNKNREASKT